jgi:hypothetical protein
MKVIVRIESGREANRMSPQDSVVLTLPRRIRGELAVPMITGWLVLVTANTVVVSMWMRSCPGRSFEPTWFGVSEQPTTTKANNAQNRTTMMEDRSTSTPY